MNRVKLLLVIFLGMTLFLGCQKWGEPEFKVDEWTPPDGDHNLMFWTIGIGNKPPGNRFNILSQHALGAPPDPIRTLDQATRYVRAVVVSSDEGGNYYKSMVIQDSTAGVEMQLDLNGLYNIYPVGQKIVLICNGLFIGDYNNLPQVGWIYQGTQVGRINSMFFDNYIIKDGLPSLRNLPKPLTNNEIDFSGHKDINKLVRLEKVKFKENALGQPLSFNEFTTDWIVYVPLANGREQEVTVRTSNFAKFRSMTIEDKEYNLTGILTIYRNTYQFMIRTKEDIEIWKSN